MIDKDWRLQRYQRKDYSELVEFPVEIVGRDGMVRRYSFEDSVRLYQRRITFAPLRYRDVELVQAELGHCRSRIEQLRRSYFYRHGWGTPEGQPRPMEVFGELAGELAAFLRRVLRAEGRPDVHLEPLVPPRRSTSAWRLVRGHDDRSSLLLYVYGFDLDDRNIARDAFFTALRRIDSPGSRPDDEVGPELSGEVGPAAPDEQLVAFHHTVDCGFILTSRGDHDLGAPLADVEDVAEFAPTPWDEALDAARHGELTVALTRCKELVRDHPWHRKAYVLGAAVSAHVGDATTSEGLAELGRRYFPDDPMLHYYEGLAIHRTGRPREALGSLRRAHELDPRAPHAVALLALALVGAGRAGQARATLRAWQRDADAVADADVGRLATALAWRGSLMRGGLLCAAGGALAAVGGLPAVGLCVAALGVGAGGVGRLLFRRQAMATEQAIRFGDVVHGLKHIKHLLRTTPRVG